jgi:anti-sigma factor RsiW
MNCKDWEERIALHAGGDLSAAEGTEVERHLAECAVCRTFASGIEESLDLLRSAHEEPIAAGHYAAVRAAVLARLTQEQKRRRVWRQWIWAPVCAAGLALAAMLLTVRPAHKAKVYVAEVRPPQLLAGLAPQPTPVAPHATVRRTRVRRVVAPGPPPLNESLVVKLITNDPDVIIYWIADRKGDEK